LIWWTFEWTARKNTSWLCTLWYL